MEKFTTIDPRQIRSTSFLHKIPFLKELEGKPFGIALVTPMLAFSTNGMYLSRLSGALSDEITPICPDASARFAVVTKANSRSLLCAKLTVIVRDKPIYEAYLFSLSATQISTYVTMPFLCTTISKNQKVMRTVLNFIEQKYRCSIFPCSLSDSQFQWMWGIAVNETLRRDQNVGMTVSYYVLGSTIHLTLSDDSLARIWDSCVNFDPESNDVSWEDIQIFRESLHEHFLNTYQVNMSSYAIERVVLEGVSISTSKNGVRLNVTSFDMLFVLLKYIETACVKPNHYLTPRWSTEEINMNEAE